MAERAGADDLTQLLSQVERAVTARLARVLAQEGCTVEEWRVLCLLADGRGHPMNQVADFALLPAPTLTRLVDRLVANNLVYRRVDPTDRRRVLVQLTARGRARQRRLNRLVQDHQADLTQRAGEADAARLAGILDRLRSDLT